MKFSLYRLKYAFPDENGAYAPPVPDAVQDSADGMEWTIEIDTLEGLLDLVEQAGHDVIVHKRLPDGTRSLTIYDDYLG